MKESIRKIYEKYDYANHVPLKGLTIDGRPALTGIDPSRIGEYVIITVRDPLCDYKNDPAAQLASYLENGELVAQTGMFTTYSGYYGGAHISIASGGSGSPEAELILHEFLENTNASTYLRVGGSGGMHESVRPGDVVISRGVVRDEGMTQAYVSASYPAASSYEVVMALVQAGIELGVRFHVGVTRSSDSDFCGVGRPSVGGYMQPRHLEIIDYYRRAGVLNGDRESAAIVTLATLFGRRGGSICSVADNIVTGETFTAGAGHDVAIKVALQGLAILHEMDIEKSLAEQDFWTPGLRKPDTLSNGE
jgi:uridine phosphorylase